MYELRILSGLHRGATLPLHDENQVIGASEEADVVLVDPGIAQRHATLALTESGWMLSAQDGGVRNAYSNQPQASLDLVAGDFARVGDVWLTVVEEDAAWVNPPPEPIDAPVAAPAALDQAEPAAPAGPEAPPQAEPEPQEEAAAAPLMNRRVLYALMSGVAIFTGAAAYGITYTPPAPAARPQAAAVAPAPAAAPAGANSPELRKAFKKRLADADLLKRFDLNLDDQGWKMRAALDDEETDRFERILAGFVKSNNITFPVSVKIGGVEAMLPFKIRQVISGANAGVITQEGERLYVGDEFRGIRLVAVNSNYVSFAGKRKVVIRW